MRKPILHIDRTSTRRTALRLHSPCRSCMHAQSRSEICSINWESYFELKLVACAYTYISKDSHSQEVNRAHWSSLEIYRVRVNLISESLRALRVVNSYRSSVSVKFCTALTARLLDRNGLWIRLSQSVNMLNCRYGCNRQFRTLEDMENHRDAYHGIGRVFHSTMMKCRYGCERLFETLEALMDHKKAYHGSSSTADENAIIAALKQKKRSVIACNDCGKDFSSVDALRQHQMTQKYHIRPARDVGSFGCEACPRTLRTQESLEQHFVADHSLIQLAKGDKMRAHLEKEFVQNWRKPSICGTVTNVSKVYNLGWRVHGFEQYKRVRENNGNEVQRYHGTSLLCELGLDKNSKLCQLEGCNLCSILRSGFKAGKARTGWQRFGPGIYTTATSGKSNDYIRSSSNRRAVLICRVAAGKVFRTQENMPNLDCPPPGYDSVSGEVGKALNYDETVVIDTSSTIWASYVPCYRRPPGLSQEPFISQGPLR